jgi:hypothetical protein
MHSTHLNEHDANQGAQSNGEFLGMTGNSGWYLLGSGGATILMVIFLWGIFGVSLLLCLLVGVVLCGLSVAYVFTLKNNRPEHYDTDFFESALVEAGVVSFQFGPRARRPANPFAATGAVSNPADSGPVAASRGRTGFPGGGSAPDGATTDKPAIAAASPGKRKLAEEPEREVVARTDYERFQEELTATEEMLEDALAERGED